VSALLWSPTNGIFDTAMKGDCRRCVLSSCQSHVGVPVEPANTLRGGFRRGAAVVADFRKPADVGRVGSEECRMRFGHACTPMSTSGAVDVRRRIRLHVGADLHQLPFEELRSQGPAADRNAPPRATRQAQVIATFSEKLSTHPDRTTSRQISHKQAFSRSP